MQCNTPADDYELHYVSENPLDQREFTPPLEQDIVGAGSSRNVRRHINCVPIHRVFDRFRNMCTPYIEADSMTHPDIEGSGTCKNVRSRLSAGHSSMLCNANMFSGAVELRPGTSDTIRGRDINCVPIHRVFDRFRNMCTPYIEADSMTHPDIEGSGTCKNVRSRLSAGHSSMLCNANMFSGAVELRPGTSDTIRGRGTANINCVPVRRVFDRFRNMCVPYIEADCMTQPAIRKRSLSSMAELYPTVCAANCQSSKVKMLSSASDCLIQRSILTDARRNSVTSANNFPTNALEDIHDKHLLTKYSHGCAQYVHNEAFAMNKPSTANARKRMTTHPLLIACSEELSSSGNMIRRFTLGDNNQNPARSYHMMEANKFLSIRSTHRRFPITGANTESCVFPY
nr:hypothetical protein [Tanacetum cinerariifolium]